MSDSEHEPAGPTQAERPEFGLGLMIVVFVTVALIWVGMALGLFGYFSVPTTAQDFGGAFGFVESLFSGLALGGVIVAILLQRQELRLQRYELEWTRKELARTADAQMKSEQALNKQATTLLTAAYLNALQAYREAKSAQIDSANARDASKMRSRLDVFEATSTLSEMAVTLFVDLQALGIVGGPRTVHARMAHALVRCLEILDEQVMWSDDTAVWGENAMKAIREVLGICHNVSSTLSPDDSYQQRLIALYKKVNAEIEVLCDLTEPAKTRGVLGAVEHLKGEIRGLVGIYLATGGDHAPGIVSQFE